jgi:(R,R)-butanediol dehydrogenase / meso-butanediol dehydrogenase / diacetyl reductase
VSNEIIGGEVFMKAAVIKAVNNIEVCEIEKPKVKKGHVLLKLACSGFCGPTDMGIIEGMHPRAKFPLIFCHEFSGVIEETGEGCSFKKGEEVAVNPLITCNECNTCRQGNSHVCESLKLIGIDCDGGFAEYCLVPQENLVSLPPGMPLKLAAIAEPVAVGLHAVRGSVFKTGDSVMVFGAGPIGLITATCLKTAGAGEIIIVEKDEKRIAFAKSLGFEVAGDLDEFKKCNKRVIDEVFDTTGSPELLAYAVDLVKIKGFIAIVGKFDYPALVNLHDVLFKELTIKGFRVYRSEEFKHAVKLISGNPQYFEKLITDVFKLDKINDAVDAFKTRRNLCKIMIMA